VESAEHCIVHRVHRTSITESSTYCRKLNQDSRAKRVLLMNTIWETVKLRLRLRMRMHV